MDQTVYVGRFGHRSPLVHGGIGEGDLPGTKEHPKPARCRDEPGPAAASPAIYGAPACRTEPRLVPSIDGVSISDAGQAGQPGVFH